MGMKQSYTRRSDVLNELKAAFDGEVETKFLDGNDDGRFIASRIAFEAYTPEEMDKHSKLKRKATGRAERLKKEQAKRRQELEMFRIAYEMKKSGK
jgi:hypothetical protein